MQRTYIKHVKEHVGEQVLIKGFVHTIRDQGSIKFMRIRDVTGILQVVVLKSAADVFQTVVELTNESVVEIIGLAKETPQAPEGIEIEAKEIKVLSYADATLPIPVVEEKGADAVDITKRFDWRWLDLRKPEKFKIFQVWTELEKGFRKYWDEAEFTQIYTPSLMNTASESGAEVFEVSYFDRNAYLAQSPQFYKQMALASGFDRVFMVGPVYRAEPSYTTRHMTEFTGWDFELAYIDSHYDVMAQEEKLIVAGFTQLNEKLGLGLKIPSMPFPKISMQEAKEKLAKAGIASEKAGDLSPEEERELSRMVKEETGNDFVFVTEYPISVRPFYHMRIEEDQTLTKSFDLLYKGLEITTGAQREHRYDVLIEQAKEKGMDLKALENYLNFFKYGCPPHGGVGMGPGRMVMMILGYPSVKEITYLPRDVKRLTP